MVADWQHVIVTRSLIGQGAEDLDKCHNNQQGNVHSELKKEMAMLQKKILMDTVSLLINNTTNLHERGCRGWSKGAHIVLYRGEGEVI